MSVTIHPKCAASAIVGTKATGAQRACLRGQRRNEGQGLYKGNPRSARPANGTSWTTPMRCDSPRLAGRFAYVERSKTSGNS